MKKPDSGRARQLSLFEKEIKEELEKMNKVVDFLKHKEKKDMTNLHSHVDKMISHLFKRKQK